MASGPRRTKNWGEQILLLLNNFCFAKKVLHLSVLCWHPTPSATFQRERLRQAPWHIFERGLEIICLAFFCHSGKVFNISSDIYSFKLRFLLLNNSWPLAELSIWFTVFGKGWWLLTHRLIPQSNWERAWRAGSTPSTELVEVIISAYGVLAWIFE